MSAHFHHLFAFPRFAIIPTYEHKAFVPYSGTFAEAPNPHRHRVVQARVSELHKDRIVLDRYWQGLREIPYDYLVMATGTKLRAPGTMQNDDKPLSVKYLQGYQQRIKDAKSVAIIGGGAVGVQMATDLKEIYPEKEIMLVHSRDQLMPVYHNKLSDIIKARCHELGIKLVLGSRVNIPADDFQQVTSSGEPITISLQNGNTLSANVVIPATGQTPNTQFLRTLPPSSPDSLINPANGFVRVRPTLQLQDPGYPHIFAVGDVADSGAHKAARPGAAQAQVVARNILALVEGREAAEGIEVSPAAIHLTLGLRKNLIFRNPDSLKGETEPTIMPREE
ncbi:hypothetical protein RRF57_012169 [Xylaria bambusicola]|uniref:FAD/NAD(P)-binding domain-containing protein n=1 Tax=Xylaria bambusicola TaxID=326684 RepID=A0AAN7ZAH0_9PEZI